MSHSVDQPFKKATILLVDDSQGDRKLMSYALSGEGYQVMEAGDGMEGLKVFKEHSAKIDLILTDILMPGMDGVQFVQHIRGLSRDVKVVLISGYKRFGVRIGGQPVDFVEKSPEMGPLLLKIRQVLDERGAIRRLFQKGMSALRGKPLQPRI